MNERFHTDQTALEHLRRDARGRSETIEDADRMLRAIREEASKAIHASATCAAPTKAADDDEDQDKDEDTDNDKDEHKSEQKHDGQKHDEQKHDGQKHDGQKDEQKQHEQRKEHATKPNVTFTETDPAAIAEKAVTMMDLVLETAKKALPSASPKPHPSARPEHTERGHG